LTHWKIRCGSLYEGSVHWNFCNHSGQHSNTWIAVNGSDEIRSHDPSVNWQTSSCECSTRFCGQIAPRCRRHSSTYRMPIYLHIYFTS
jgi:hypothetical protein